MADDFAGVWADSRYWAQAEPSWRAPASSCLKIGGAGSSAHLDWLAETRRIGASCSGWGGAWIGNARALQLALNDRGIEVRTDLVLLDAVWEDRAALPAQPCTNILLRMPRRRVPDKLSAVRQQMRSSCQHHWISTLDDIAWLTNLRGSDVSYNPCSSHIC